MSSSCESSYQHSSATFGFLVLIFIWRFCKFEVLHRWTGLDCTCHISIWDAGDGIIFIKKSVLKYFLYKISEYLLHHEWTACCAQKILTKTIQSSQSSHLNIIVNFFIRETHLKFLPTVPILSVILKNVLQWTFFFYKKPLNTCPCKLEI